MDRAVTPEPTDRGRLGRRAVLGAAVAGAAAVPLAAVPAEAETGRGRGPGRRVRTGADRAAADGWSVFDGHRIGVITNPTGVLSTSLHSVVDTMVADGVEVGAVFGPEHGFRGTAQAGDAEETFVDERTGVTVYDAYGADAAKLAGFYADAKVDTVVFDIQDAGARFYTYIWTMHTAMVAAIRTGRRFVVLDRPNPTGGKARGPLLRTGYTSGVGLDRIVQAHGLSVGELARYFDGELMPAAAGGRLRSLQVVEMSGWDADGLWADTGLAWVPPSPNMPTADTALLYPGTCLFEATNLSEGRGTTRPFELIGAPYVDQRWAQRLEAADLPGVTFREAYFTPTFSKQANTVCGGVQVHLREPHRVDTIAVASTMIVALRDLYPEFGWRTEADGTTSGRWIDLLTGSDRFRTMLAGGATAPQITGAWRTELAAFDRRRRRYFLYRR